MRRFWKYFFRAILFVFVLLLLIPAVFYIPAVQRYVKNKAVEYVTTNLGMQAGIDHFSVKFPFNIKLRGVYLGQTKADTMVYVKGLQLDLGIWKLLRKQLAVENLQLDTAKINIKNDTTGMLFQLALNRLDLKAPRIYLGSKKAEIDLLNLTGGNVFLVIGKSSKDTVSVSKPFDWTFWVKKLDFKEVDFRMESLAMPLLMAGGKTGRIINGEVAIGQQYVTVDSVDLSGGYCRIRLGGQNSAPAPENVLLASIPWTVKAASVQMDNNSFRLSAADGKRIDIELTGIGVQLDSVYNRGTVVKADLKRLQAVQPQGIRITSMKAGVDLDTAKIEIAGAYIQTANSTLRLDAVSDASISGLMKAVPLNLKLSGVVGLQDVSFFLKEIPAEMRRKKIEVNTDLGVSADRISIRRLLATMPGNFNLNVNGEIVSFDRLADVSGNLDLNGNFQDVSFINEMMGGSFKIPKDIRLTANMKADKGKLFPSIRLFQGKGKLSVNGSYGISRQAYDLVLIADSLQLAAFMPGSSLGLLTAQVKAAGRDFHFGKAEVQVAAKIEQLYFNQHNYRHINLDVRANRGKLDGSLKSEDKDMLLDITFNADSVARRYVAELNGDIQRVDLFELNFMKAPMAVAMGLGIKAAVGTKDDYLVHAELENLRMDNGSGFNNLGNLMLHLDSDRKRTDVDILSGDFNLNFHGDTAIQHLGSMFAAGIKEVQLQVAAGKIDLEQLKDYFPQFTLDIESEGENVFSKYLATQGISFKNASVRAGMKDDAGFHLYSLIKYPLMGKIEPDSVELNMDQKGIGLDYSLLITNSKGNLKDLYKIRAEGSVQQNIIRVGLKQQNEQGEIGVDFGLELTLGDTTYSVSMYPMTPVLGYSRWIVNPGNHVTFYGNKNVDANLKLTYEDKLFSLQSQGDKGNQKDRLQVEVKGIDLTAVSSATPFIPDMGGVLSTDLLFYRENNGIVADGLLGIREFYYNQHRIGSMELDVNYMLDSGFTDHTVDFTLHLDSIKRALVQGEFSTSEENKSLLLNVRIPSLPLYVVSAFMPENLLDMRGELTGNVELRGTFSKPEVNGGIAFRDGKVEVLPLGTAFGLDTTQIRIQNNKIVFNRYRFIAPNKQFLIVNGNLSMLTLSDIRADLSLKADNFQIVDVKQNPKSLVYGKAFVNLDATAKGPVNALKLNGNVNLLNNTEIDYVLRSSGPELRDRSVDLVRFVSFADTSLTAKDNLTNRVNANSFSMKMLVEIGNAVKMNINLSDDGENQVQIQGGGNLVYSMNDEGRNSLIGKYTLTGGNVRYGIPVVGEKNFTIQGGSYVEWTGDLANPTLNITASESLKASVSEDNQSSRLVNFEALIRIQNTLQKPEITFDMSAPNDQTIQNQLATFSPEERTKQAMNLLIYGTYSGPGAVSSSNTASSTLNSFIEKELNQWTRKYLKNSGLSFGVDSYNQYGSSGQETQRTDYSYQFSKQFFNDRVSVKIGGRISTDNEPGANSNMEQNLVDDIAVEYVFDKNRSLFLKVFRHTNYESVLDGEVTQTGAGVVWRKSFRKVRDLFIRKSKRQENISAGNIKTDAKE